MIFLSSIVLIPFPVMAERSFNLFSFNVPAWSLFWEYIASILYAFILYKISRRYLLVLITISAATLCLVVFRCGNLMCGWSGASFWDGAARISYSFTAGLLIYRFNWIIQTRLGFIALLILLA